MIAGLPVLLPVFDEMAAEINGISDLSPVYLTSLMAGLVAVRAWHALDTMCVAAPLNFSSFDKKDRAGVADKLPPLPFSFYRVALLCC